LRLHSKAGETRRTEKQKEAAVVMRLCIDSGRIGKKPEGKGEGKEDGEGTKKHIREIPLKVHEPGTRAHEMGNAPPNSTSLRGT